MRIGVLTSSYPRYPGDGAGVFVRSLTEHLAALGHEPWVLAPDEPSVRAGVVHPPVAYFRYAPVRAWQRMGYGLALEDDRRLRWSAYALIPAYLAGATFALTCLVLQRKIEVLHCHWVIPNGPMAALVSALTRVPLVMTLHGSDLYVAERWAPAGLLARLAFRQASVVTACSPDLAEGARRLGARPEATVVLPWGADPDRFGAGDGPAWRRQHQVPREALVVLAAGRLVEKKGLAHLVEAAPRVLARHSGTRFVVVGDGPLLDPLRAQATALGVGPAFRFVGRISWDEMPDALAAADIFAAPSVRDREGNVDGLPTVILEAMAAGRPVVASDLAGIPLVVRHGDNGLLTPPGQPVALAEALLQLLDDGALRERLGQRARQRVEQEFTWRAIAARFGDIFAGV